MEQGTGPTTCASIRTFTSRCLVHFVGEATTIYRIERTIVMIGLIWCVHVIYVQYVPTCFLIYIYIFFSFKWTSTHSLCADANQHGRCLVEGMPAKKIFCRTYICSSEYADREGLHPFGIGLMTTVEHDMPLAVCYPWVFIINRCFLWQFRPPLIAGFNRLHQFDCTTWVLYPIQNHPCNRTYV